MRLENSGGFMARRVDNECAWCAEEIDMEKALIGSDRKTYCSPSCLEKGQQIFIQERQRLMNNVLISRQGYPPVNK